MLPPSLWSSFCPKLSLTCNSEVVQLFSQQLWQPMKRPRVDFLPSTELHEESELWYQQWCLAPICLLGECRQIWVSLSWFLNLLDWLRFWVLSGGGAVHLTPPSRKDTGGGGREWSIQGIPTPGLDPEGAQLKDTDHPVKRYWVEGLAERCQENCPHSEKVLGREGLDCDKIEEYPGLCWKILRSWHWGHAAVEQLRGWSDTFLQFDCLYRICQDKSEENTRELCSEKNGQDSSRPVSVFSADWEIYRSSGGLVLILCSGPIGKPTL